MRPWTERVEFHAEEVRGAWGGRPSALSRAGVTILGIAVLGAIILLLAAGLFVGVIAVAVIGAMIGLRLLYLRFIRPTDDTLRRNVRLRHGDGRGRDTGMPYE